MASLLGITALAAGIPLLQTLFTDGYMENALTIGASQTNADGYTLTVTDAIGTDKTLYLGLRVTAPVGTVLNAQWYDFDHTELFFHDDANNDLFMSGGFPQMEDLNPDDNAIDFVYTINGFPNSQSSIIGNEISLHLDGLHHAEEVDGVYTDVYDTQDEFYFPRISLDFTDSSIKLAPMVDVETLGVVAEVTHLEISPLSIHVQIEGDALIGHHDDRLLQDDNGTLFCVESQDISLFTKDGQEIMVDTTLKNANNVTIGGSIVGSGCSGGHSDSGKPGSLTLVRSFGFLLDLETVDFVRICGVDIPVS